MKKTIMTFMIITVFTFIYQFTLNATVLTFDYHDKAFSYQIPDSYGDNVVSTSDAVGNYEIGNGWTNNVKVDYRSFNTTTNESIDYMWYWDNDYGDLIDVAYASNENGTAKDWTAEITLTAQNGYDVTLNRFDLAGWPQTDREPSHLRILDGDSNILEILDGITIVGADGHSSVEGTWTSSVIKIQFGNDWNIGIDNISFDESLTVTVNAVSVDIKPGSCPNPLNVKSKGNLPVAILGTLDFDVRAIDVTSITLNGVAPVRSGYEDVTAPAFKTEDCDCEELAPDSYEDLELKFDTQEIVDSMGDVDDGEEVTLTLTGKLLESAGGTGIEGVDCVLIKDKGK